MNELEILIHTQEKQFEAVSMCLNFFYGKDNSFSACQSLLLNLLYVVIALIYDYEWTSFLDSSTQTPKEMC